MKPILGIETTTDTLSVALVQEGRAITEIFQRGKNIHDEMLHVFVTQILDNQRLRVHELGGIAVSEGPGSFTGLRIGMSYTKGIAYSAKIPLVCVPTMDGIAHSVAYSNFLKAGEEFAIVFDARREDVYVALYRMRAEGFERIIPAYADTVEHVIHKLSDDTFLLGDGADKIVTRTGNKYRRISGELAESHAISIALLGEKMIEEGKLADIAQCEPNYVKDFFSTMKI